MYGPKETITRCCMRCPACVSERYHVQGDSGSDVYCAHPNFHTEPKQRKSIGDTTWTTPSWCPALTCYPKAREVARIGDMSQTDALRVGLDSDGDVYLSITNPLEGVEFCTIGSGGGKSPRTQEALIALMTAMEADNAQDESHDWWAQRQANGTLLPQEGTA